MSNLKYELYFMNVPFNSTYQHTVLFDSLTSQINTFKNLGKNNHYTNLNIIIKNSNFIINGGKLENISKFNYMMYKSNEDTKWTYSFIDDVIYDSYRGTIIFHHIDVWQTYQWYSSWNSALIERGCVSNDRIGRWLAPEPIGFGAEEETEISIFSSLNFTPIICVESLSLPFITKGYKWAEGKTYYEVPTTKFEYGGVGSGENITGYYRIIPNPSHLKDLLNLWQQPEFLDGMGLSQNPFDIDFAMARNNLFKQENNHIGDIIAFKFLPQFILETSTPITTRIDAKVGNDWETNVASSINYSTIRNDNDTVNINNNKLACGYTPVNKKMYTSLARAFKIFNRDGLNIPLRPELIKNLVSSHTLQIQISIHTFGDELKISIPNYKDITNNFISVPYSYSFNYGINNNVGVTKETKIMAYNLARLSANLNYVSKGIGIAGNIAGAYVGAQSEEGLSQLASIHSATRVASGTIDLANNMLNTEFDLATQKTDAYMSQVLNIGTVTGDRINLSADNVKLRFAECNPTINECRVIDDFLSRYGYSIMEFGNLFEWCTTRKHWNYIKTKNASITADAPNNDIKVFNSIFDNGTTIWHDIDEVGNFNLNNEIRG